MSKPIILALEVHKYAPELNTLILRNGARLNVGGCTTISEARKKAFPKPFKGLGCIIGSKYDEIEYKSLNRPCVASGLVDSRLKALRYSKQFQQTGGALLDGSILPPNKVTLKFKFN
jgi:hypothetical protein